MTLSLWFLACCGCVGMKFKRCTTQKSLGPTASIFVSSWQFHDALPEQLKVFHTDTSCSVLLSTVLVDRVAICSCACLVFSVRPSPYFMMAWLAFMRLLVPYSMGCSLRAGGGWCLTGASSPTESTDVLTAHIPLPENTVWLFTCEHTQGKSLSCVLTAPIVAARRWT